MSAFEQTIIHLPIILTVLGSPLPRKTQDWITAIYTSLFIRWRHNDWQSCTWSHFIFGS